MIRFILDSGRRGVRLIKVHRSFVYTAALLVIIPVTFVLSGQQFLDVAREHQTRAEKNRIGLLHDAFVAYTEETQNTDGLVRMATQIATLNPDIRYLGLVTYREGIFTSRALAGDLVDENLYTDLIKVSSVRLDESVVFETRIQGESVRVGVRAIAKEGALPEQFLVTTFSTEASDAVYRSKVRMTYLYLLGVIFLIMLLVIRHARIINYADLYTEQKRALSAKTAFITMTAHELRSPLSAIRGYASMLVEAKGVSKEKKEYAKRIEESSAYMIGLVSDMLDVAKIESGGAVLAKDRCLVEETLLRLVSRLEALATEHGIALRVEGVAKDLAIMADRTRLEQILVNLISNALKYTKEGSVTLAASVVHGKCEIRIKDTGVGMSAEDQQKLFAPFFRTEDAEISGVVGTGLGMWITKQFIEAMGGSVDVESIRGVGTHIVVKFPTA